MTAAATAADGIQVLRNVVPDVVLADIQLADRDASWVLREARKRGLTVPFIAISAYDYDPNEMEDAGFDASLRKPLDYTRLVDTILAVIRSR